MLGPKKPNIDRYSSWPSLLKKTIGFFLKNASIMHAKKVNGEIETIRYWELFSLSDLKIVERKLKMLLQIGFTLV